MNFNGLKSSEVEVSRTTYGSNKLPEPELKKWYHFAKEALTEPITMILIIIALFQLVLGAMGVMSLSEPVMIIVVLAIVTEIAVKTGLGIQKSAPLSRTAYIERKIAGGCCKSASITAR